MESGDLHVVPEHSSYKSDLQKNQIANLWQRQKMKLSQNIFVELE